MPYCGSDAAIGTPRVGHQRFSKEEEVTIRNRGSAILAQGSGVVSRDDPSHALSRRGSCVMSAVVIDFSSARARFQVRAAAHPQSQAASATQSAPHDFTFWRGAAGSRYVHTVYTLLECPELPDANVMLVRRHPSGRAEVMHIGCVEHGVGCSNLAEIRLTAAKLGANEVHVHLLAADSNERAAIERDLSGADELAAGARH